MFHSGDHVEKKVQELEMGLLMITVSDQSQSSPVQYLMIRLSNLLVQHFMRILSFR